MSPADLGRLQRRNAALSGQRKDQGALGDIGEESTAPLQKEAQEMEPHHLQEMTRQPAQSSTVVRTGADA